MKFGSVKFFKRLIVLSVVLVLLVPVVLAVVFGVLYFNQKQLTDELYALNNTLISAQDTEQGAVFASPQYVPAPTLSGAQDAPAASFEYQTLYPEMYAVRQPTELTQDKVCYLTFDDGPTAVTQEILDTLQEEGVKATFFVTGENAEQNPDILRAAADAGHSIGVHTYSHEYEEIYADVDSFLEDFHKMYTLIGDITGSFPTIFRFPGGSINVYNQSFYTEIVAEMTRRGFVFFDWNASAEDAVQGGLSAQTVENNVLSSASGRERAIVLMHDSRYSGTTADALPNIIEELSRQGYSFAPLTSQVQPIAFYPE